MQVGGSRFRHYITTAKKYPDENSASTRLNNEHTKYPTVDIVIKRICCPDDDDVLFKSRSRFFGPGIPRSAQLL